MEEFFAQHFFFSLASVSFYCKGCAGIVSQIFHTPPVNSQMDRPLSTISFVELKEYIDYNKLFKITHIAMAFSPPLIIVRMCNVQLNMF